MKKSTGKREGSKARKPRADIDGDALAVLEQQQRDIEELIARFDSTDTNDETEAENG